MSRGRGWTIEDDQVLASHVGRMTWEEIGDLLRRPRDSVRHRAYRLGLRMGRKWRRSRAQIDPERARRVEQYAAAVARGEPIHYHEAHEGREDDSAQSTLRALRALRGELSGVTR